MSSTAKAWLYSLASAVIGGGSSAALSALAMPDVFNFTPAGWGHLWKAVLIGALIPALTILKQSPLPVDSVTNTISTTQTTKLGAWALISLLFVGMASGCNATTAAQDIVDWTPTVISTANTVGATVSLLAPQDAVIVAAAVAGFDAAAQLFSNQAQTYLNNPNATALQQLQAQVLAFQQNVNLALLQAAKIVDPASQQKIMVAIQGLATALTAVLGLISTIKGNTVSPALLTAPVVKTSEVLPLMDRDLVLKEIATHYGESTEQAAVQFDGMQARLASVGF